jgi:hypothetical protein
MWMEIYKIMLLCYKPEGCGCDPHCQSPDTTVHEGPWPLLQPWIPSTSRSLVTSSNHLFLSLPGFFMPPGRVQRPRHSSWCATAPAHKLHQRSLRRTYLSHTWSWLLSHSERVHVLIPDEVIGFLNRPNPSSSTVALGSTQSLVEMSTRNFPGGKERPAHKTDNFTAISELTV